MRLRGQAAPARGKQQRGRAGAAPNASVETQWDSIPTVGLVGQFCDYALCARDAVQVRPVPGAYAEPGCCLASRQSRWGASGMKRRSFPVDPVRSMASTSATFT